MVRSVYYNTTILDYQDFSSNVKRMVHKRDGCLCQLCLKRKPLTTHHINYDKTNSHPFNLITLCWDCHRKTLLHKNDWLQLFTEKMAARFGKEYESYLKTLKMRAKSPKVFQDSTKNSRITYKHLAKDNSIHPGHKNYCPLCNPTS